ncbi:DUF1186 domain-containing protein, partial [Desulfobulbus sp. US1]|nr:DUF1186 domain-containing protein [Desulfobulbus sp. US1]
IRMSGDKELRHAYWESNEVWAPLHARRTLGMLRAAEAIPALIDLLYQADEYDGDKITEEMPQIFALIGESAIQGLIRYAGDTSRTMHARATASSSLSYIGKEHPETREACIAGIETALAQYRHNDHTLNGFFVGDLLDLNATQAFPTIQQAYQEKCVDLMVCGDLQDVEIELGLREKRTTTAPDLHNLENMLKKKQVKKIGRNESCPCGSGKKYKKCCLNR